MKNRSIALIVLSVINKLLRILHFNFLFMIKSNDSKEKIIPIDIQGEKGFMDLYKKCKDYTMTSVERMFSLYKAIEFIVDNKIPGDIVECGVWKGGSMMLCALKLLEMGEITRKIYLYDTYKGMTEPSHHDIRTFDNFKAKTKYDKLKHKGIKWDYASLNEVKRNCISTGFPKMNLIFIEGRIEETIPQTVPKKISILRLDTDWYESTYHELYHLYPKLSVNGILILDDYGHWKGAKEATDKYIKENNIKILFNRNDKTGRLGIKMN